MEVLQVIIEFLQSLMTLGSSSIEGVQYAIGPLALAGIGIGSQIVGKGISSLMNRGERRRQRRQAREAARLQGEALGDLRGDISELSSLSASARERANMTNEELYGAELERRTTDVRDTIGQQTAGAREAVTRGLLAGGGDVTGAAGITLSRLQEGANKNIGAALGQIETDISRRGDAARRYEQSRADNLASGAMSAKSNIYASLTGQAQNAETRRLQQRQAEMQLGADIGSGAADLVSLALTQ